MIISVLDEPVNFRRALSDRIATLVPIIGPHGAVKSINAYTQTVRLIVDERCHPRGIPPLRQPQDCRL